MDMSIMVIILQYVFFKYLYNLEILKKKKNMFQKHTLFPIMIKYNTKNSMFLCEQLKIQTSQYMYQCIQPEVKKNYINLYFMCNKHLKFLILYKNTNKLKNDI